MKNAIKTNANIKSIPKLTIPNNPFLFFMVLYVF